MSSKKTKRHDSLFKTAMNNPQAAREFVTSYVPGDIVARMDLATLKVENTSLFDNNLGEGIVDVLLSVEFDKQLGYVYCLCEHQTKPDKWMAFRIMKYMLQICETHLQKHPDAKYLPLVYPVLFYSGRQNYKAARTLWELFKEPDLAKLWFTEAHNLVILKDIPEEQIHKKIWFGLVECVMKHEKDPDIFPYLLAMQKQLQVTGHQDFSYVQSIVKYTLSRSDSNESQKLLKLFKESVAEEQQEEIMTIASQLIEQGKQEGINIGLSQGLFEGKKQTAINMLDMGLDIKMVADATRLTPEEIKELLKKVNKN